MSRTRRLLSTILPSMLAGGLLFGSAFGHASAGDTDMFGYWPATNDVTSPGTANAGKPPAPPKSPLPPQPVPGSKPPIPPKAPVPPKGPKAGGGNGVSVSINNGSIKIDGIKDMVLSQLDAVRTNLKADPNIPKDVRDKVLARLDKVRTSVDKRLSNLQVSDLDKLGDEMEKMGEEIEEAMEGFDEEMEKVGEKLGKDLANNLGKNLGNFNFNFDFDSDDDDNIPMAPGVDIDIDDDDMKDAITDLKHLALKPAQKDAITKLRTDSDKTVATAKKQLDDLSDKLHTALGNPATTDADIARYVDQISAQEAAIRKARLLAWAQARRVLDDAQRKKVQDAATKKKTK